MDNQEVVNLKCISACISLSVYIKNQMVVNFIMYGCISLRVYVANDVVVTSNILVNFRSSRGGYPQIPRCMSLSLYIENHRKSSGGEHQMYLRAFLSTIPLIMTENKGRPQIYIGVSQSVIQN